MCNFGEYRFSKTIQKCIFVFGIILTKFHCLSFIGETSGVVYPSTIDCQISNPCAYIYFFILMLQKTYFCPSNHRIPFLYMLFLSMIYLLVLKLISKGTGYDTDCWITERGGESVIKKFNHF